MIKQLNAFEIKREISRLVKALEASAILVDPAEFRTLDGQSDKQAVAKILMKEFYLCNEETLPVIKVLLLKYAQEDVLLEELEKIIKDPKRDNNIKLHAIELISSFKEDWQQEGYETYLIYDEELVQKETKELLENSKNNPDIQLDFLDFFNAIPPQDRLALLSSMKQDQSGEDLANILIPIFLSYAKDETGLTALKMIGTTKSEYAYKSLVQVIDNLNDKNTKQAVKRCINELKLSGAGKAASQQTSYGEAQYFIVPPDGEGNFSLIYRDKNKTDKTVRFAGIVIDDYTGIRECLGFNSVTEFEASFLMEKITGADFMCEIKPEIFKMLLNEAEKLNYKKSVPPYEYNCWKRIFLDIPPADISFKELLSQEFNSEPATQASIDKIMNAEFTVPWFYTHNFGDETEQFFAELDQKLKINPIEKIDIDSFLDDNLDAILYNQEKINWKNRLIMTAYIHFISKDTETAEILFKISQNEPQMRQLYRFIVQQSIFQYFLNMLSDKSFLKYKQKALEANIAYLEQLWGFYV